MVPRPIICDERHKYMFWKTRFSSHWCTVDYVIEKHMAKIFGFIGVGKSLVSSKLGTRLVHYNQHCKDR